MQTDDKSGIVCDVCATQYRSEFTYFSLDLRLVAVLQNRRPALVQILTYPAAASFDICPACYDGICKRVVATYKPVQVGNRCDLSGRLLTGSYEYYYGTVAKVEVNVPAKDMRVTERILELDVSREEYQVLVDRAGQVKATVGQWSAEIEGM